MYGLCGGSIFLQYHSSYLFGSLTYFYNSYLFIIIIIIIIFNELL